MAWRLAAALLLAAATAARAATPGIDVNRADQASLETVKGVGPALSEAILAARDQAPFKDWADLRSRVKGIGADSAAKLSAAGLTVDGAAYGAATSAPRRQAPE